MFVFLLCACNGAATTAPVPIEEPPPRPPEPVEVEPPPRPALPPLPPADPRVTAIFADAETFRPRDFTEAMDATLKLGPDTLPSLLRLTTETSSEYRLWALCEAIQRLEVRDERVPYHLREKLGAKSELVVSSCGQAIAHSLPLGSPDLTDVLAVIDDGRHSCSTRRNLALGLREPSVCRAMQQRIPRGGCDAEIGTYGLSACPDVEERLLAVAGGDDHPQRVREIALFQLKSRAPLPHGRWVYLGFVDSDQRTNGMADALYLLAEVGTEEDLPLLQKVIDEDPHGGESIHAIQARRAIRAIRQR